MAARFSISAVVYMELSEVSFSRIRENEPFNSPINSVPQCESLFAFFTLAGKGLLVLITNTAEFNKKPLI